HLAFFLTLLLILLFLIVPAKKGINMNQLPWYDFALIILSIAGGGYVLVFYSKIIYYIGMASVWEQVLGVITIILILEAARRTVGWALVVVAGVFIIYPLVSNLVPGFLHGRGYSLARVIGFVYFGPDGIFGISLVVAAGLLVIFILFGHFLQVSGAGEFFLKIALSLVGRVRGGPAKVAVIASSLFGTMSGSSVANVVTTGMITIPMMKKAGYRSVFAGAVESVASCGGQIMPPVMGVTAFVIAEFLGISYAEVVVAALLPAILYYICVFVQVDFEAARMGLVGLPREDIPPLRATVKEGWQFILPLAVLIFFLLVLFYSPEKSALFGLVSLIVVSQFKKYTRINPRKFLAAMQSTGKTMLEIGSACAAAQIVIGALSLTGLGLRLSSGLLQLSGGNLFLLLVFGAIAGIILGMGLPSISSYIILAVTVAPALTAAGLLPIASHLFVFFFGILSFLTPPVCVAVYAAAGIARAPMFPTALQAMRLGIVAYLLPFIFVYSPSLLLIGSPLKVVLTVTTSIIGAIVLAGGIEGYLLKTATWLQRIMLTLGGIGLLIPPGLILPGLWTDIIGAVLLVIVIIWQKRPAILRN
ncbi:MAG: TRAP transporter permease, partial [Dehalococcoidales bacterium]|nr:TRAP transporter permease [Dehalococcoidales bacterium]